MFHLARPVIYSHTQFGDLSLGPSGGVLVSHCGPLIRVLVYRIKVAHDRHSVTPRVLKVDCCLRLGSDKQ